MRRLASLSRPAPCCSVSCSRPGPPRRSPCSRTATGSSCQACHTAVPHLTDVRRAVPRAGLSAARNAAARHVSRRGQGESGVRERRERRAAEGAGRRGGGARRRRDRQARLLLRRAVRRGRRPARAPAGRVGGVARDARRRADPGHAARRPVHAEPAGRSGDVPRDHRPLRDLGPDRRRQPVRVLRAETGPDGDLRRRSARAQRKSSRRYAVAKWGRACGRAGSTASSTSSTRCPTSC